MKEIFIRIVTGIGIVLVGWIIERIAAFINSKIKNDKIRCFLDGAVHIVTDAVKATYQESVEAMKKAGTFDSAAQKQALEDAKSKIRLEMTTSMRQYLEENVGDFEIWMETTIHSVLYDLKK